MTQNPFLLVREFFIAILYYKLANFSWFFFLFFLFFTQNDNLCCFSLFNLSFCVTFCFTWNNFCASIYFLRRSCFKILNLRRKQIIPTCYNPKHKFFYVFSFICEKVLCHHRQSRYKGKNRYLYPIFIIVSDLPMIPASQTSPCLGENRTLSKNALGFYAKMHKKLVNYS